MSTKHVIWKFPILIAESQVLEAPRVIKLLRYAVQAGQHTIWAIVDPQESRVGSHIIRVAGTGTQINMSGFTYLNSIDDGAFVWHCFWKHLR